MLARLRKRKEWQFFAVLPKVDAPLALAWWTLLLLRGALPALFAAWGGWSAPCSAGRTLALR
jgi:hypothetical protein